MQPATCLPKLTADARLAGWLLAAILAHALLLLVPAQYGARSGEALPGLAVALLRPPLQPPATASAPRKEPPPRRCRPDLTAAR
jgi:hypothetical protein